MSPMHPILLQAGPVTIGTHDAFSVVAVVVGFALYWRELRRRGWLDERIVLVSLAVLAGGVIGARVITAWERVDEYQAALDAGLPATWVLLHGGKSLIGALAGGFLGGVLAKRALGYRRSTGDAYVLAIPVASAIGRIGCFLSELPLGTPTSLPWGITVDPAAAALFPRCPGCDVAMHPSMLYEVLFNLVAIPVIVRSRPRVPVQGDLLKGYLLAAFAFRFWVETVRANEVQALGLTGPQLVLLPLIAWLVVHFARRIRSGAYRVPVAPAPVVIDRSWRGQGGTA
jgi:prolipoprotein diacylglyceryltransferase